MKHRVIEKGEKSVERRVVYGLAVLMASMLLLGFMSIFPAYSLTAEIYLVPSVNAFDTATTSVGYKWNITVWVKDVTDLYAYQGRMNYNSTMINATGAWLPTWDSQWVFYGRPAISPPPVLGNGSVIFGDSLMVGPGFSGTGKLAIIEMKILTAPPQGGQLSCALAINNVETFLLDSYLFPIPASKTDGSYLYQWKEIVGGSVTWKWLNAMGNPVWLTANVTVSSSYPIENFNFNRTLGQISFNITSVTSGLCNVTVPKLLMDGAFKVLINDTLVPSILTWNKTHTFVYFTYDQGTHNIKIIGEIVTRIRGPDLLTLTDVNGDGIVNIVDIVVVALRFDWEEDP